MFATTVLSSYNLRYSDGVICNLQVFTSITSSVAERHVVSRSSVASIGPYIYFDSAFVGLIYIYIYIYAYADGVLRNLRNEFIYRDIHLGL